MAENNENALQRVEMSAEEYAAFQEFQAARAKEAAQNRVNALRENYKQMSEKFIARTIKKLTPLSEAIRQKKAEVLDEAAALQKLKAELLEIDGKSMPKSHTFTSEDGTRRVTIGVYETDGYDDTVEEGVAIVKAYIEGLASERRPEGVPRGAPAQAGGRVRGRALPGGRPHHRGGLPSRHQPHLHPLREARDRRAGRRHQGLGGHPPGHD